jgi:acyl-CoA hydrolase
MGEVMEKSMAGKPPEIAGVLEAKRGVAEDVFDAAVTTFKNVVDCVVTEYGVAELRGSSIRERTRKLIGIAHPKFRDGLTQHAKEMGYL